MSGSRHTPGPWRWVDRSSSWDYKDELPRLESDEGAEVLWLGDNETYYPTAGNRPNEADAALIAAAPELLEALKALLAVVEEDDFDLAMNHGVKMYGPRLEPARAAIARAEGTEP